MSNPSIITREQIDTLRGLLQDVDVPSEHGIEHQAVLAISGLLDRVEATSHEPVAEESTAPSATISREPTPFEIIYVGLHAKCGICGRERENHHHGVHGNRGPHDWQPATQVHPDITKPIPADYVDQRVAAAVLRTIT